MIQSESDRNVTTDIVMVVATRDGDCKFSTGAFPMADSCFLLDRHGSRLSQVSPVTASSANITVQYKEMNKIGGGQAVAVVLDKQKKRIGEIVCAIYQDWP